MISRVLVMGLEVIFLLSAIKASHRPVGTIAIAYVLEVRFQKIYIKYCIDQKV